MQNIKLRDYQQKYVDNIKLDKSNLIIAMMRAGKTLILKGIVDKYFSDKKVLILVGRRNIVLQLSKDFAGHSFILSGKEHNKDSNVDIGTFQTLVRRDIDLNSYDMVAVDECFPKEVEVLTNKGFVNFDKVDENTIVAQYNSDNELLSYTKPTRIIKKVTDNNLVRFTCSGKIDIPMTHHHEVLYKTKDKYIKSDAIDTKANCNKYLPITPINFTNKVECSKLTPEEKLSIAFQADGSIHTTYTASVDTDKRRAYQIRDLGFIPKKGSTSILFGFSKVRKLVAFQNLLKELEFTSKELKIGVKKGKNVKDQRRFIINNVPTNIVNKNLYDSFNIEYFDREKAIEFIEYLMIWDGYIEKGQEHRRYYSNTNKASVDFAQTVAVLAGYGTYRSIQVDSRSAMYNDIHRLFITMPMKFRSMRTSKVMEIPNTKDTNVYCVEVPDGNIVIRSSNQVTVIGNCHERYNTAIVKEIRKLQATRIFLTGTPLTSKGTFIDNTIDNILEYTTAEDMIAKEYLAKTKFYSKYSIVNNKIGIRNGEYIDSEVEQLLDKQGTIKSLVEDNEIYKWNTEHKAILYVNSIKTATKVLKAFNDPDNVKVIHSKLTKQELTKTAEWFDNAKCGIILNVRMYTTGVNIPSCDTILYLTPTAVLSLFLQSIWRASTKYNDKVAKVYDYSGVLTKFDPYYNDWKSKKPKQSCMQMAMQITDPEERHYAMKSCKGDAPISICNGQLPSTYTDNPFVINFSYSGRPCKEVVRVADMKYWTTEVGDTGIIEKHSLCKCGCSTVVTLKAMTVPKDLIQVYDSYWSANKATVIVHPDTYEALMILDDENIQTYRYEFVSGQKDIFNKAKAFFKGKQFSVISNAKLSELPNIEHKPNLDILVDLINWDGDNKGLPKKIAKLKMDSLIHKYGDIKPGYCYYASRSIAPSNSKAVIKFLNSKPDRRAFVKFFMQLNDEKVK